MRTLKLLLATVTVSAPCADRALATSDTFTPILMPIENLQSEGYCEWDAVAFDPVSNLWSRAGAIGKVLSGPVAVPMVGPAQHAARSGHYNANPIAEGEGQITIRTDVGENAADLCTPTVEIAVSPPSGASPADFATFETRIKLAALFSLRNYFALSRGAKVRVTISGLPDRKSATGTPLFAKTEYPYTEQSPHYLALIKELASSDRCQFGRRITPALPKAERRASCR